MFKVILIVLALASASELFFVLISAFSFAQKARIKGVVLDENKTISFFVHSPTLCSASDATHADMRAGIFYPKKLKG